MNTGGTVLCLKDQPTGQWEINGIVTKNTLFSAVQFFIHSLNQNTNFEDVFLNNRAMNYLNLYDMLL